MANRNVRGHKLDNPLPKRPPARTEDGQESRMIAYARDLAEIQLRDGTASSALVIEYIKMGSTDGKLKRELMKKKNELMKVQTEAIQSAKRVEELYNRAFYMYRKYTGEQNADEHEDSNLQ